jgi:hypothetical protein
VARRTYACTSAVSPSIKGRLELPQSLPGAIMRLRDPYAHVGTERVGVGLKRAVNEPQRTRRARRPAGRRSCRSTCTRPPRRSGSAPSGRRTTTRCCPAIGWSTVGSGAAGGTRSAYARSPARRSSAVVSSSADSVRGMRR